MSPNKDKELVALCPNLYRDRYGDMRQTCMCWGFAVGDGWYSIVRDLSVKLEALIVKLPEKERLHTCASQVKEKFGGLRFYMTSSTDEMDALIGAAEAVCAKTCEVCGAPGKLTGSGWLATLCTICHVARF